MDGLILQIEVGEQAVRELEEVAKRAGVMLTPNQIRILSILEGSADGVRASDVSVGTNSSYNMKKLEGMEYVTGRAVPGDRRLRVMSITPKGSAALDKVRRKVT